MTEDPADGLARVLAAIRTADTDIGQRALVSVLVANAVRDDTPSMIAAVDELDLPEVLASVLEQGFRAPPTSRVFVTCCEVAARHDATRRAVAALATSGVAMGIDIAAAAQTLVDELALGDGRGRSWRAQMALLDALTQSTATQQERDRLRRARKEPMASDIDRAALERSALAAFGAPLAEVVAAGGTTADIARGLLVGAAAEKEQWLDVDGLVAAAVGGEAVYAVARKLLHAAERSAKRETVGRPAVLRVDALLPRLARQARKGIVEDLLARSSRLGVTVSVTPSFETVAASLVKAKGSKRGELTGQVAGYLANAPELARSLPLLSTMPDTDGRAALAPLVFDALLRLRDVAAVDAYLRELERLDLALTARCETAEDRSVFLSTFAPRLASERASVRGCAAKFLEAVAKDEVELADHAASLLRALVDGGAVPGWKTTVAALARSALASGLAFTKRRDAFVTAAKLVDVDLDDAQRRSFRKELAVLLPDALAALGGKPTRTRRPLHETALLAAIHEAPDDDGPRLVYADALLEAGDARGELIVLQCERAAKGTPPSARELELLRLNARAWLGPLAPALADPRFERGFLIACTWKQASWSFDETKVHGHPAWSTIAEINLKPGAFFRDENALLSQPVMAWLRTLTGIDRVSFAGLERNDFEHVGLVHFQADEKTLAALARHERLLRIDVDRDPIALRAWVLDEHPSVQSITWEGRRFDRNGRTWIESKA